MKIKPQEKGKITIIRRRNNTVIVKRKKKKIVLPNGRESAKYKEIRPNILLACAYFS